MSPRTGTGAGGRVVSIAGPRLAALLLGAACVAWAATPFGTKGLEQTALFIAIVAVLAGGLRLAFVDVPQPEDYFLQSSLLRAWLNFLGLLRAWPWEEIAVVGLLVVEVQHPARPWHTAALGAGLAAYLLVTHIAESGADPAPVLRRQVKVLAVGACLLAVGAGFALLPAATPGAGAAILRVLAAVAVIAAAALVLPA